MNTSINLLDVVALTEDFPDQALYQGQVGTVVEDLAPDVFEVEFSDDDGHTYATLGLRAGQLMVLHHRPGEVAALYSSSNGEMRIVGGTTAP